MPSRAGGWSSNSTEFSALLLPSAALDTPGRQQRGLHKEEIHNQLRLNWDDQTASCYLQQNHFVADMACPGATISGSRHVSYQLQF